MSLDFSNATVVVADKTQGTRSYVRQMLYSGKVRNIIECNDGVSVIESIQRTKVDAMFIDINIPILDIFGICSIIRKQNHPYAYTPIIGFSNLVTKKLVEHCIKNGINDILLRPFSTKSLLDKLHIALVEKREYFNMNNFVGPVPRNNIYKEALYRMLTEEHKTVKKTRPNNENKKEEDKTNISKIASVTEGMKLDSVSWSHGVKTSGKSYTFKKVV